MLKSKIARKLSLYFAVTLITFSLVIGGVFTVLFRNHTLSLHKSELERRATSIAKTLSGYTSEGGGGHGGGMGGYGAYMRFIEDIAGTDVWIVDSHHNLTTLGMGMGGHGGMGGSYNYNDLPQNAEEIINEVFSDKVVFSEDFSNILSQLTLTVGVPIKDRSSDIVGVVLLHSPVYGIRDATNQGITTLFISMGLALILSIILSIWLSKRFTDPITQKEAEDALRLEKIRQDFVANVSHELKTPVTVIRGSLEALIDKVVIEPQKVEDYHVQMLTETKFLERLVGDLLDLSRLQNTDFIIEKSEISISDVIDDAVRSAERLADEKNVRVSLEKSGNIKGFYGDYGRLRQMLMIIIDNAIKFSHEGGNVEIKLIGNQISIRDYGEGISTEHLPHIFDRFYKSRNEDNKKGTGLGLAIAKQIADRHGISLSANSIYGSGTEFIFQLPQN